MRICLLLAILITVAPQIHAEEASKTGTFSTTFKSRASYANAQTIMQRMMLGTVYRSSIEEARQQGTNLKGFTVNPVNETWDVYVPMGYESDKKYGVLVWVPEGPIAEVPSSWKSTLEKHRLIYVAPRRAGNREPTLERRIPLLLLALSGIARSYHIDVNRIYIGGAGGGAEVAGNVALGFPDVFKGALFMNDGPDLGTTGSPVPQETLVNFARRNTFVFISARDDGSARRATQNSLNSFQRLCFTNLATVMQTRAGDESLFDTGLSELKKPGNTITANSCTEKLTIEMKRAVEKVANAAENANADAALKIWQDTYLRFGNLIDEPMQEIKRKIDARIRQRAPSESLTKY